MPTINERSLNLNTTLFHANDMTDALTKENAAEYYVRVGE
jgi:hypothetical protein